MEKIIERQNAVEDLMNVQAQLDEFRVKIGKTVPDLEKLLVKLYTYSVSH